MELGDKLRQARQDAGISQRQLCGDTITRNMLSQIENGSARPSMTTLQYLAQRLGKPVAWFLEDGEAVSPNQVLILRARQDPAQALDILAAYQQPDPVFDPEYKVLQVKGLLFLAEQALEEGKKPYALSLLEQAEQYASDCPQQKRQLLLLKYRAQPSQAAALAAKLPNIDEELLLRAAAAAEAGDLLRAGALLDSAEDRQSPTWCFARGEICFALKEYARAASFYEKAESAMPRQALPRLEACWQQLEDYKKAYYYACRQRELTEK